MPPPVAVVVPSRGRAEQCARLVDRIAATTTTAPWVIVIVDGDDPTRDAYTEALGFAAPATLITTSTVGHVAAVNAGAAHALTRYPMPRAVAKLDDDHWPVTYGWDGAMLDALTELGGGIVYGDDLLQGQNLPTAPMISTEVLVALGFMGPPALVHMFVDDFWRDLGTAAGCLRFLSDVLIEHRHHSVGKASFDKEYGRTGTQELFDADQATYAAYRQAQGDGFHADVDRVQLALNRL